MKFLEWRDYGIENGWISHPVCEFHEGIPLTDEEVGDLDKSIEVCVSVSRYYEENLEVN